MIALIQRVAEASVVVTGETIGAIGTGIVALIGVEKADTEAEARRLLERILGYRIFADADDKMNLSLADINGGLLLVPQFTLAAEVTPGTYYLALQGKSVEKTELPLKINTKPLNWQ